MFRHLWTIVTVVMCTGGFTGYSLMRVASAADAAEEAMVAQKEAARDVEEAQRHQADA